MSDYRVQNAVTAFDDVTLTGNYAENMYVLAVGGMSKLSLDINYAMGAAESANICHLKVEHSTDGTNWYQLTIDDTGTVTDITGREWNITGNAALNVILDIAYKYVRLSLKESGVAANAGKATVVTLVSGL